MLFLPLTYTTQCNPCLALPFPRRNEPVYKRHSVFNELIRTIWPVLLIKPWWLLNHNALKEQKNVLLFPFLAQQKCRIGVFCWLQIPIFLFPGSKQECIHSCCKIRGLYRTIPPSPLASFKNSSMNMVSNGFGGVADVIYSLLERGPCGNRWLGGSSPASPVLRGQPHTDTHLLCSALAVGYSCY